MDGKEVVDLVLSDDDADDDVSIMCPPPQKQQTQQIDLTDDLDPVAATAADAAVVEILPPPVQSSHSTQAEAAATAAVAAANRSYSEEKSSYLAESDPLSEGASTSTPQNGRLPSKAEAETSNSNNYNSHSAGVDSNHAAATAAAAAAASDDPVTEGVCRCASCAKEIAPRRHAFVLERCGHRLCPACMVSHVSGGRSLPSWPDPVCPVGGCAKAVSVRDLALVLQEKAWGALQESKVAAFRVRAWEGIRCPGCSAWVHPGPPTRDAAVEVTDVPGGRRSRGAGGGAAGKGGSGGGGSGTARRRAEALLSTPFLVCKTCSTKACRFCGTKTGKRQAPTRDGGGYGGCGCGGAKLWSVDGLLGLLGELDEKPPDAALLEPSVLPAKKSAVGVARGGGRGGGGGRRGRGRGRGSGRGYGHGAYDAYGYGYGYGHGGGGGGGRHGISSKWSKGTGFGGGGDTAASAAAQAAAADAEERGDRAMVCVLDALTSCLPSRGDCPDHVPALAALVRDSSLLQVVCAYLRNDSLMDIAKRREVYQSLFKVVMVFALHEILAPLVDSVPPKGGAGAKAGSVLLGPDGGGGDGDSSGGGGDGSGGGGGNVAGKGKGKRRASREGGRSEKATRADSTSSVTAALNGGEAHQEDHDDDDDDDDGVVMLPGGKEAVEGEKDEDDVSIADLLASANRQARVYANAPGVEDKKSGDAATMAFALQVTEVHDKVKASLSYLRGLAEARASSAAVVALISAMGTRGVVGAGLGRKRKREQLDCVEVSLESRYLMELGDSRFEVVPLLGGGRSHHFAAQASQQKGRVGGRARTVRISQEVSSLATSLPVQPDSSIFLRVDEDRFDVMRAMIIGPKDTPYEGGCFEFDLLLPPDYPDRPPQVHFLTTGNGRIRFNPNLYNNGKVCLSLLGTWSGPGWNAKTSTLLQVLISIQSLIFVAEPYFNEPGYEGQLGTPQGRVCSWSYNSRVRNATLLFAVVAALEARSGPMRDVIRKHFRLMKGHILRTARAWLMEASGQGRPEMSRAPPIYGAVSNSGCGGDYAAMAAVVLKVERLVSAL